MNKIEIISRGSLDKIDTTVTIKMGTKHHLADIASKGESYDDVISRILHENEQLKAENELYERRLEQLDALDVNVIDLKTDERAKDAVKVNDELAITFTYNKPSKPVGNEYRMGINIESYILNGKKVKDPNELALGSEDVALLAITIITKIINTHFDSAFSLSRKANVIDRRYWKKVCNRTGLPMSAYLSDIMPVIGDYERGLK